MRSLVDDLAAAGQVGSEDRDEVLATIEDAGRGDRFSMALTMYAVAVRVAEQEPVGTS